MSRPIWRNLGFDIWWSIGNTLYVYHDCEGEGKPREEAWIRDFFQDNRASYCGACGHILNLRQWFVHNAFFAAQQEIYDEDELE